MLIEVGDENIHKQQLYVCVCERESMHALLPSKRFDVWFVIAARGAGGRIISIKRRKSSAHPDRVPQERLVLELEFEVKPKRNAICLLSSSLLLFLCGPCLCTTTCWMIVAAASEKTREQVH